RQVSSEARNLIAQRASRRAGAMQRSRAVPAEGRAPRARPPRGLLSSSSNDVVAEAGEGGSGGDVGEGEEFGAGVLRPAAEVGACAVHGGVGAQEGEGLGVEGLVGEVLDEEFAEAGVVRAGAHARQ